MTKMIVHFSTTNINQNYFEKSIFHKIYIYLPVEVKFIQIPTIMHLLKFQFHIFTLQNIPPTGWFGRMRCRWTKERLHFSHIVIFYIEFKNEIVFQPLVEYIQSYVNYPTIRRFIYNNTIAWSDEKGFKFSMRDLR